MLFSYWYSNKWQFYNKERIGFGPGGDEGDRTPDLGIANAALSHLSYIPTKLNNTTILNTKGQLEKEGCIIIVKCYESKNR